MIENEITLIYIARITVEREKRLRAKLSEPNIEGLMESICTETHGLINPITVTPNSETTGWRLVAGEHRLAAFVRLFNAKTPCPHEGYQDWTCIPARVARDISVQDFQLLELEENVRRADMDWQDEVAAIAKIHRALIERNGPQHSLTSTAGFLNVSSAHASRSLRIATAIEAGDKRIIDATGPSAAYNVLAREEDRKFAAQEDELSAITNIIMSPEGELSIVKPQPKEGTKTAEVNDPQSIFCRDFVNWSDSYTGAKFNLGHFDFPYGINWDKAKKGSSNSITRAEDAQYSDSWETYVKLCTALCDNWNRLFYSSAHFVFWLSARHEIQEWTRNFFNTHGPADLRIEPQPLIWHRSDNSGTLPDPDRGTRWVYETALFMTTGDRKITKAKSNLYAAPSGRADRIHISEKPESMLRHFMEMLVDGTSEMLDPTCGSGTSLRAAEALGAKRVIGSDLSQTNVDAATEALTKSRRLRTLQGN